MKKHIEKLRERSEEDRKKIATIFAGIVTFIIFVLWILFLVFVKPGNRDKAKNDFSYIKKEIINIFESSSKPELELQHCGSESLPKDELIKNNDKTL